MVRVSLPGTWRGGKAAQVCPHFGRKAGSGFSVSALHLVLVQEGVDLAEQLDPGRRSRVALLHHVGQAADNQAEDKPADQHGDDRYRDTFLD